MKLIDVALFSLQAAIRGRMRVFLTMLAVAIGVCSVVLIGTLGENGTAAVNRELDKLGFESLAVYGCNEKSKLYPSDAELLKNNISVISDASPIVMIYGSYRIKGVQSDAVFWGIDSNADSVLDLRLLHGRMLNENDIRAQKNYAVVDTEFAQKYYSRDNIVGKTMTLSVEGIRRKFEVIGVVSAQKDMINQLVGGAIPEFIYVPYTSLNQMRSQQEVTQIAVRCIESVSLEAAEPEITGFLKRSKSGDFDAENIAGYVNGFRSATSLIALIISAIAAISLCVAGLGIMNAMLASVTERQKEIGICMAIGAKGSDIVKCFMAEGAIISAIGGLIGGAIGSIIAHAATIQIGMPLTISFNSFLIMELAAISCGIVFSVIPAIRASKLNPIQALRSE